MGHLEVVRLWLPIRSLGSVNAYLFQGPGIIDPGMLHPRAILQLLGALREHGGRLHTVEAIVLTHFHVDHSTMTALLALEGSPRVYIGRGDLQVIRDGVECFIDSALKLFTENGMPRSEAEAVRAQHPALRLRYAYEALDTAEWRPLAEGDHVKLGDTTLTVLETPGHTPGSITLYNTETGELYTGDTLLPGITPHITLHDPQSNPLGDYLKSLERIARLSAKVAFPGHRDPIRDPAGRAREIIRHHEERLQEILGILWREGPLSGYEVARRVRWRTRYGSWSEYPPAERFFAMGEALAHLRLLEVGGLVERVERGGATLWRALTAGSALPE